MPILTPLSPLVRLYSVREWRIAGYLFVSYVIVYAGVAALLPQSAWIFPASGIALAALYFGGLRLWPIVILAALAAGILAHVPAHTIFAIATADTLQAVAGAYLLRKAGIDPLFRRYRDTFYLIAIVALVSLIAPTLSVLVNVLAGAPSYAWQIKYASMLSCLLIVTPFLLRWFAKLRFGRTPLEILELVSVFGVLILLDFFLFVKGVPTVDAIPLVYFLLIPLFWIALRLRPRFITLALLITAIFAIESVVAGPSSGLAVRLFATETFMIILTIIFYIIASLEEDRRVGTNMLNSQLLTLENAVSRVVSESQAKNDFIAILAHELRNPLAPVLSAIELMKLHAMTDAEYIEALGVMEDRMGTVRRLLDDLLDISRISEGKIAIKKETVDLRTVLNRAVVSTVHHRKERHQSFVFKEGREAICVEGDPVRLEQIFSNLLTNASKYSDPGDTISLFVRTEDGVAVIEVVDQGVGINPDALDAIFAPFYQTGSNADSRAKKGLGIGLALVKSFVELHGGTVRAASEGAGHGSRFTVLLPISSKQVLQESSGSKGARKTREVQQNRSVLIVDDNDAAAAGIGRLLELQSCSVSYAYTGKQAIETALELKPDIAFVDIGLPDQDGYSVAKTLRARGYRGHLIALTGYSTDTAKAEGAQAGFEHYLVKPIGLTELKAALAEFG